MTKTNTHRRSFIKSTCASVGAMAVAGLPHFVTAEESTPASRAVWQRNGGLGEGGDEMMRDARRRIAKLRKGNLTLHVVDPAGKGIPGVIEIKHIRHEFRFGAFLAGLFDWGDSRERITEETRQKALDATAELFNTGTITHHWHDAQENPQQTEWQWGGATEDYQWLIEHAMEPRWHSVVYPNPNAMRNYDATSIHTERQWWELIERWIIGLSERWGDKVNEYDVINEANFTKVIPKVREFMQQNMPAFPDITNPRVVKRIFDLCRTHFPNARLTALNDWPIGLGPDNDWYRFNRDHYQAIKDLDTPVDLWGFQGHFSIGMEDTALDLTNIERGLDDFGELGQVAITEYNPPTQVQGQDHPKERNIDDEAVAAWSENFYTLAFSKPYINELVRWFVIDVVGGKRYAGLMTEAGDYKAEYKTLKRLLTQQWSTREILRSDHEGRVSFDGFFGDYEVSLNGGKPMQVTFASEGERQQTVKVKA